MIFVDTSVWITAFRDSRSPEARQLSLLLDADEVALPAPVFLEILSGASRSQRASLRTLLAALPLFYPTRETWDRMADWVEVASESGERFGVADLLIAAISAENALPLWSLDADFVRMGRLKLVTLYQLSGPFPGPLR